MNLHNIGVISRYEVKLLRRSWLFRIFAILALLGITLTILIQQTRILNQYGYTWNKMALSSQMPYLCIYFYNIVQSIIVIFLSGSFLKRDKKLDTAEVIYVRPMSNADYIIGKTWGVLRVFLSLNIVMLLITAFLNIFVNQSPFSAFPYVFYLLTISVPSLLFVLGLSFTLTCLLKNQAVTLIVMLGIIGVTFFYLENTLNGVFDFFGVNIPAIFSDAVGHANIRLYLLQRTIFFLTGIGFISFTIALVKRLPHRPWKVIIVNIVGALFLLAGCSAGLLYVMHFRHLDKVRDQYIATFNAYSSQGKVHILSDSITIEPQGRQLSAESALKIINHQSVKLDTIIFYLNPSLKVTSIESNGTPLSYERNHQVVLVNKSIQPKEELSLTIKYNGSIDENICYTDIEKDIYFDQKSPEQYFNYGKRYAYLEDKYTILTPECLWYPVSLPPVNPQSPYNIGKNFTDYALTVLYSGNGKVLSQGKITENDGKVTFTNPTPLTGISLTIGDYEKKSVVADSTDFEVYYFKGHDFWIEAFSELTDTIPVLLQEKKEDIERNNGRDYPFSKIVLAETPIPFATYIRNWKGYSEYVQPEIIFMPERLATINFDFKAVKKQIESWRNPNEASRTEEEKQAQILDWFLWRIREEKTVEDGNWNNQVVNKRYINPMFFDYVSYIRSEDYPILDLAVNLMQTSSTEMRNWGNVINDKQRANLYLETKSFQQAAKDPDLKPVIFYEMLKLKSNVLKNYIFSLVPEEEFNTFLKEFSLGHQFMEVPFEDLDDAIAEEFGIDLSDFIHQWYTEDHSPTLYIQNVDANQVVVEDITRYQVKFKVNNPADVDAIITAQTQSGGGGGRRGGGGGSQDLPYNYVIPAGTAKEIKIIVDERPAALAINTNISHNLPTLYSYNFSKITTTTTDTLSGVFPASPDDFKPNPNEIIVDNEDPGFRTVTANTRTKLKDLLKKEEEDKYRNFYPWWVPSKWTAVAGDFCYGETINSAVCKRNGSGVNYVEWSAEMPRDGYYEVSIWNPKQQQMFYGGGRRRGNRDERNQTYTLLFGDEKENITLDLLQEDAGWVSVGNFYIPKGTAKIILTDKVTGNYVIADAVKFTLTNN